jgi:hypothetical protein
MEKPLDRAGKSRLLFVGAKGFGEIADFDDRHNWPQKSTNGAKGKINFVIFAPLCGDYRINCFSR